MSKIISLKDEYPIEKEFGELWTNYFRRIVDYKKIEHDGEEIKENLDGGYEFIYARNPMFSINVHNRFKVDDLENYPRAYEITDYKMLIEEVKEFASCFVENISLSFHGFQNSFLDFYFNSTNIVEFYHFEPNQENEFDLFVPGNMIAGIQGNGYSYVKPGEYDSKKAIWDIADFMSRVSRKIDIYFD